MSSVPRTDDDLEALLTELRRLDIKLTLDGDSLRVRGSQASLQPGLTQRIQRHKSELVTFLRSVENVGATGRIPRRSPDVIPNLSFLQQNLWLIDQLEGSVHYNMAVVLKLEGALDVPALSKALHTIIERHESLRTVFRTDANDRPKQVVRERFDFSLREWDLTALAGAAQADEARRLCHEEGRRPFDLGNDLMMRAHLLRLGDSSSVLLITKHHIASDGWSMDVLLEEMCQLYEAYRKGERNPLPPLPIQYADYSVWLEQWLQGEVLQKKLSYWIDRLGGLPAVHSLPLDRPRPLHRSINGALYARLYEARLYERLLSMCNEHDVTLFILLEAAFAVFLSRWSGERDIAIGTPISSRSRPELAGMIGYFTNTLVLRSDCDERLRFLEFLRASKQMMLDAHEHHHVPFELLVDKLNPSRTLAHNALVQISFSLQNNKAATIGAIELPHLRISSFAAEAEAAVKFDLQLTLKEGKDGLLAKWEFSTDIFDRSTIERMDQNFEHLLRGIVADPARPLWQLPMLPQAEAERIARWNGASVMSPAGDTATAWPELIHQCFERHAALRPDAPALTMAGTHVSYGELNRRANQVAHHLLALGVKPDDRVALCVERGVEMLIGLLGILKAGGAYVPLDPSLPRERLAWLLNDSAPVALLTQAGLIGELPASDVPLTALDRDWDRIAQRADTDPMPQGLASDHLAYVIYTSGSSGEPKGVLVEHRQVVRLLSATQDWFGFDERDTWTLFHSYAFDFSVWEIWGAFAFGGRLVVVPARDTRSPQEFYELLCRERVTVLNQTPGAFRQLIAAQTEKSEPHALRLIIFGGEALEPYMLQPWVERNDPDRTQLVNMYGITETTVHVTYRRLQREDIREGAASVIGRAIPDLRIYILDAHMQPVPVGVAGELYVGGNGVARGYLNRPELTRQRFVPDPFGAPGQRLYSSGDLARWTASGDIEYLGRSDFQVKIRGFRIELGEIEARLAACDGVRESVVIAREDNPGDKRLVAYVVPREGTELSASELRSALARHLAEYMIPSAFVILATLPLTSNGKLDRRALPAPEQSAVASRAFEEPAGTVEQAIATAWRELLGLQRVGRHDNFFELGGHSLLVIVLIERLRRLGLDTDVRAIFGARTLGELAMSVRSVGAQETTTPESSRILADTPAITPELVSLVALTQAQIDAIVAAVPGGVANIQDIYPLASLQEGMLFHHVLNNEQGGDAYLMRTLMAFDSRERLDAFLRALQCVIDRHDILRTAMHWRGLPKPVQVVQRSARLPVIELELRPDEEAMAQMLARTDPRQMRLDLQSAPILAAYVTPDRARGEWLLALLNHHIVEDNYSKALVFREILALLDGRAEELRPPAPYRNFIAQLQMESEHAHSAYFRAQLGDVCEPSAPFGLLDVLGEGSGAVRGIYAQLDTEEAARVRETARHHGVTPAVLFHVAWALLVAQTSGRDDVVFGTVLSGRMHGGEAADEMVGMFINTLPIRVVLKNELLDVVRNTHARLSELLMHEQASLARAQRSSSVAPHLPLFTSMLNYRRPKAALAGRSDPSAGQDGMRVLWSEERTNYPFMLAVDDMGVDLCLTLQCVDPIEPAQLLARFRKALAALVDGLSAQAIEPLRAQSLIEDARDLDLCRSNARADHVPPPAYEPPTNEAEIALAQLWKSLLQVQRVGRHDNFFDLGGHSILAMQLVARIHGELGVDIPLIKAMQARSLADLSTAIAASDRLLDRS